MGNEDRWLDAFNEFNGGSPMSPLRSPVTVQPGWSVALCAEESAGEPGSEPSASAALRTSSRRARLAETKTTISPLGVRPSSVSAHACADEPFTAEPFAPEAGFGLAGEQSNNEGQQQRLRSVKTTTSPYWLRSSPPALKETSASAVLKSICAPTQTPMPLRAAHIFVPDEHLGM